MHVVVNTSSLPVYKKYRIVSFLCIFETSVIVLCLALLSVHSGFAIILMGERELVALFVFLVPRDCCVALPHDVTGLQFMIVVFPDHTHLPFCSWLHGLIRVCISDRSCLMLLSEIDPSRSFK